MNRQPSISLPAVRKYFGLTKLGSVCYRKLCKDRGNMFITLMNKASLTYWQVLKETFKRFAGANPLCFHVHSQKAVLVDNTQL